MNSTISIRTRTLIPLTLTFLVLLLSFLFSSFAIRQANVSETLNRAYGDTISIYKELLFRRVEWMTAAADPIINDPSLKRAMRQRDRGALYKNSLPFFQKLNTNNVTHFYFHDLDTKNFLRVHLPDRHSDIVQRDSLNRAIKFGTPAYGTEVGPFGTLTLRLVIPWKDQKGSLGFIELGTDVSDILSDVAIIHNIDYLITINNAVYNTSLEAQKLRPARKPSCDQFPGKIVYDTSLNQIPPLLIQQLSTPNSGFFQSRSWQTADLDTKRFAFKTFPFTETSGREIGNFILLFDTTQQTQKFYHFIFKTLFFSSVLCLFLFSIAWRTLGRVDRTVADAQQKLADEIIKTSESNKLLETEVGERQKAEATLIHLNSHLEEKISERTKHLERASKELEKRRDELESAYSELKSRQAIILHQDKMASIGLLAAGVAHDINNPIGFVTNNLEELHEYLSKFKTCIRTQRLLIQETASADILEKLQENYKRLGIDQIFDDFDTLIAESLEGTNRIGNIVKNLRNFSRIDDADYKLTDINECLEYAIKITQYELRNKAQVIRESGNIPSIYCCPQQMNQVFMNLLVNAAHAIEKRGEITIRTWADSDWVYISIADTGCGISDEVLHKIFEPFFTTKEINKGTGLGLNIVSDIVTQHRGKINVDSKQGNGTTFTIRLPNITKASDD